VIDFWSRSIISGAARSTSPQSCALETVHPCGRAVLIGVHLRSSAAQNTFEPAKAAIGDWPPMNADERRLWRGLFLGSSSWPAIV
jgi:hypothetical protein